MQAVSPGERVMLDRDFAISGRVRLENRLAFDEAYVRETIVTGPSTLGFAGPGPRVRVAPGSALSS